MILVTKCMYVCIVITYNKGKDQPDKMFFPLSPFAPENLVSRDGFGSSPVPCQLAHHLHTQAESGAYLLQHGIPPEFRVVCVCC